MLRSRHRDPPSAASSAAGAAHQQASSFANLQPGTTQAAIPRASSPAQSDLSLVSRYRTEAGYGPIKHRPAPGTSATNYESGRSMSHQTHYTQQRPVELGPRSLSTADTYGMQSTTSNITSNSQDVSVARGVKDENLAKTHFAVFDDFLRAQAQLIGLPAATTDSTAKQRTARQKLVNLSRTQFQELSTDVYDEIRRRTSQSSGQSQAIAANSEYHPKRNQAREKLSNLPAGRFRDLATDVAMELERRCPPVRKVPLSANTYRQTAVHPIKGMMMEEDEEEDENERADFSAGGSPRTSENSTRVTTAATSYGLASAYTTSIAHDLNSLRSARMSHASSENMTRTLADTTDKLAQLELQSRNEREQLRAELAEASSREARLRAELDRLRHEFERAPAPRAVDDSALAQLKQRNQELEQHLGEQEQMMSEVKQEARDIIKEMKIISDREDAVHARAENLQNRLHSLQSALEEERERHAEARTKLRQFRATSHFFVPGPGLELVSGDELLSPTGIVVDAHAASFKRAVDDLLRIARQDTSRTVEMCKEVLVSSRKVQKDIEASDIFKRNDKVQKLCARLNATATNLVTACRNHREGGVLSPVSLLDAAASHISATVIELCQICKLRHIGEHGDPDQDHPNARQVPGLQPPGIPSKRAGSSMLNVADLRDVKTEDSVMEGMSIAEREARRRLEVQTERVVTLVQDLLQVIRDDSSTHVVGQRAAACEQALEDLVEHAPDFVRGRTSAETQRSRDSLLKCGERFREAVRECESRPGSSPGSPTKDFKQRLAGLAFDTAKLTKEYTLGLQTQLTEQYKRESSSNQSSGEKVSSGARAPSQTSVYSSNTGLGASPATPASIRRPLIGNVPLVPSSISPSRPVKEAPDAINGHASSAATKAAAAAVTAAATARTIPPPRARGPRQQVKSPFGGGYDDYEDDQVDLT